MVMRLRLSWIIVASLLLLLFSPRLRERIFSYRKDVMNWIDQVKRKTFFFSSKDLPFLTSERNGDPSKSSFVFNQGD
jgi:hypothetical protein